MTTRFDNLLESLLLELTPGYYEGDYGGLSQHISSNVPPGITKGHWAPIQKLGEEDRAKVLDTILKDVFTEEDGKLVANADSQQQLHVLVKAAIQKASSSTPLKAAGNWAAQFLADRIMTLLRDKINYTTQSGEEISKPATQKDFRKALNTALTKMETKPGEAEDEETEESPSVEPSDDVEEAPQTEEAAELSLSEDEDKVYEAIKKGPADVKGIESLIIIHSSKLDEYPSKGAYIEAQLQKLFRKGLATKKGSMWYPVKQKASGAALDELESDEDFSAAVEREHEKLRRNTAGPRGAAELLKRRIASDYEGGMTRDTE